MRVCPEVFLIAAFLVTRIKLIEIVEEFSVLFVGFVICSKYFRTLEFLITDRCRGNKLRLCGGTIITRWGIECLVKSCIYCNSRPLIIRVCNSWVATDTAAFTRFWSQLGKSSYGGYFAMRGICLTVRIDIYHLHE